MYVRKDVRKIIMIAKKNKFEKFEMFEKNACETVTFEKNLCSKRFVQRFVVRNELRDRKKCMFENKMFENRSYVRKICSIQNVDNFGRLCRPLCLGSKFIDGRQTPSTFLASFILIRLRTL